MKPTLAMASAASPAAYRDDKRLLHVSHASVANTIKTLSVRIQIETSSNEIAGSVRFLFSSQNPETTTRVENASGVPILPSVRTAGLTRSNALYKGLLVQMSK